MESRGYYSLKLIKTNKNGIPDLIFIKGDKTLFVEVKRPQGKMSKLQEYRIKELKSQGIEVKVWTDIDTDF